MILEKKEKQVRFFKAKVLNGHNGEEINETIKESIDNQSIVFTDKSASYVDIADFVELHIMEKSSKETTEETLNGFISPLVTPKEICWVITTK